LFINMFSRIGTEHVGRVCGATHPPCIRSQVPCRCSG
jgi:hypothetical protein